MDSVKLCTEGVVLVGVVTLSSEASMGWRWVSMEHYLQALWDPQSTGTSTAWMMYSIV